MTRPHLRLRSGNAYAILGEARKVARGMGWSLADFDSFVRLAKSGTYEEFLEVVEGRFSVTREPTFSMQPEHWSNDEDE